MAHTDLSQALVLQGLHLQAAAESAGPVVQASPAQEGSPVQHKGGGATQDSSTGRWQYGLNNHTLSDQFRKLNIYVETFMLYWD